MKESLHAEIISLANQISKIKINSLPDKYYNLVIELFEKTILFKNMNSSIEQSDLEDQLAKNNLHLMSENSDLNKENNKDAITPLIETIKEMIPEMPENDFNTAMLNDHLTNFSFEKKNTSPNKSENQISPKLNDRFAKILKVDVNDRLAFIQKLFDNKSEEYEKVMSEISVIEDWDSTYNFIQNKVKPEYNSWNDNLLVEKRFFNFLKKQFN